MFTFLSIWDAGAFSVFSSKLPAVERAFDAIAHDVPAGGQVSPEVRAVSVDHVGLAILGAKGSELFPCGNERLWGCKTNIPTWGGQGGYALPGPFRTGSGRRPALRPSPPPRAGHPARASPAAPRHGRAAAGQEQGRSGGVV